MKSEWEQQCQVINVVLYVTPNLLHENISVQIEQSECN